MSSCNVIIVNTANPTRCMETSAVLPPRCQGSRLACPPARQSAQQSRPGSGPHPRWSRAADRRSGGRCKWMTLPQVRIQERTDDPAPAPTFSSDLWLPWRVTPLCVCSSAVHCTAKGVLDPSGSPTGTLVHGCQRQQLRPHQQNSFRARWPRQRALLCSPFDSWRV